MNPPKEQQQQDVFTYRPAPEIVRADERVQASLQGANQLLQAQGAEPGQIVGAMLGVMAACRDMIVLVQADNARYTEQLFRHVNDSGPDEDVLYGVTEETAEDLLHVLSPVQELINEFATAIEESRGGKVKLGAYKEAIFKARTALDHHADALAELVLEEGDETSTDEDDEYTPLIAPEEEEPEQDDDDGDDAEEEEVEEAPETKLAAAGGGAHDAQQSQ